MARSLDDRSLSLGTCNYFRRSDRKLTRGHDYRAECARVAIPTPLRSHWPDTPLDSGGVNLFINYYTGCIQVALSVQRGLDRMKKSRLERGFPQPPMRWCASLSRWRVASAGAPNGKPIWDFAAAKPVNFAANRVGSLQCLRTCAEAWELWHSR